MSSGYSYFCGANVYIKFNDEFYEDVAGIQYELLDSSAPVYGYSSRLFDAVASGQKIVKGTFVLNYTTYNELTKRIFLKAYQKGGAESKYIDVAKKGIGNIGTLDQYTEAFKYHANHIRQTFLETNGSIKPNQHTAFNNYLVSIAVSDAYGSVDGASIAENLSSEFNKQFVNKVSDEIPIYKVTALDAMLIGPFNIKVEFQTNNYIEIVSCYVNSIGSTIQISEDVILQEFSFFGRNIISNS